MARDILKDVSADDKVGLTTILALGNLTIAIGELIVAAKAAKSDLGTVTKWFTVTALAGNAASLMRSTKELLVGEEDKLDIVLEKAKEAFCEEKESEETPEETEPEKVEET